MFGVAFPAKANGVLPSSDCDAIWPSILAAHNSLDEASSTAAQAGNAAIDVGQSNRPSSREMKQVEDAAPVALSAEQQGLRHVMEGAVAIDSLSSPEGKNEAAAILGVYQTRLFALRTFTRLSLAYERSVNSRNISASRARWAHAFAASEGQQITTNSQTYGAASAAGMSNTYVNPYSNTATTYGTANGNYQSSTTSTTTVRDPGAGLRASAAQNEAQAADIQSQLDQAAPTLEQALPLVQDLMLNLRLPEAQWTRACPSSVFPAS